MKWIDIGFALLASLILWAVITALCCCSAGASDDCERVKSAINSKAALCGADFAVKGDCDAANYVHGSIDDCLAALKAASCEDLRQVARDRCLSLFDRVGP